MKPTTQNSNSHSHSNSHSNSNSNSFLTSLRANLAAFRVFWPSWVLVILLYTAIVGMVQGQDLLQQTLEHPMKRLWMAFALAFAAFTVWYSARLYGFTRLKVLIEGEWVSRYAMRLLAFLTYTVVILGVVKLNYKTGSQALATVTFNYSMGEGSEWTIICLIVFALSIGWFFVIKWLSDRLAARLVSERAPKVGLRITLLSWAAGIGLTAMLPGEVGMIVGLLLSQLAFTFLMTMRRKWSKSLRAGSEAMRSKSLQKVPKIYTFITKQMSHVRNSIRSLHEDLDRQVVIDALNRFDENLLYTIIFNVLALSAALIMALANWNFDWARAGGGLTWVIIGLTGIMGTINLVRSFARAKNMRFIGAIVIVIIVMNLINDPHHLKLLPEDPDALPLALACDSIVPTDPLGRYSFQQELDLWLQHSRQGNENKRLVFVMSDGGAHRSGQWVSLMLEQLDREAHPFAEEVFCFAGASGGSIGNASYFAAYLSGEAAPGSTARAITQEDYFAHTVATMLGHDALNQFLPFFPDRGSALNRSFAHVAAEQSELIDLTLPFTSYIRKKCDRWIPILTLNTTRIEDAAPGLISTMAIGSDETFSHRPDILLNMPHPERGRFSSMAMLSARFPYLSPAAGVPTKVENDDHDYYVDGGYMDNSGAGIVLEMLMALEDLKLQNPEKYGEIVPLIIHIRNSEKDGVPDAKVHPLLNNLAAPVIAIVGSYGEQTDILTERLCAFLAINYEDAPTYVDLNLFETNLDCDTCITELSFNWMISDRTRTEMERMAARPSIREAVEGIDEVLGR